MQGNVYWEASCLANRPLSQRHEILSIVCNKIRVHSIGFHRRHENQKIKRLFGIFGQSALAYNNL